MIYLIAGLAFFIAMAALFLASDATRKAERQLQNFLVTYLTPIKESSDQNTEAVKELRSLIKTLEKEIEAIRNMQIETMKRVTQQDEEIRETHAELAKLDRSILPQFKKGAANSDAN